MATVSLTPGQTDSYVGAPGSVALCTALAVTNAAGPQDSTNVARRGPAYNGGAVVIANTGGATPTIKVDIQGSMDGTVFYNVPYAVVATPRTFVVSQITLTTTATNTYLLQELVPWVYLKLV